MDLEKYSAELCDIVKNEEYIPLMQEDLALLMGVDEEEKSEFFALIEKLIRAGELAQTKRKKITSPEKMGLVVGVFRGTSKHFGFVTPTSGKIKEDIFIPAAKTRYALDGDKVLVRLEEKKEHFDKKKLRRGREGKLYPVRNEGQRSASKGIEGEVVKITERALRERNVIGVYYELPERVGRKTRIVSFIEPDSKKLPYSVFVHREDAKSKGVKIGDKVEAKITYFPSENYELTGEIIKNFGDSESRSANYEAILVQNGIETEFDEAVLREAEESAKRPIIPEGRCDLRDKIIFTIDGADAKDLDDAISLEIDPENGNYILGVHIADVAEYVKEGTRLDKSAMDRGTSVYFTDKVVPMLPKALSNGSCSLGAGLDRYALSARITLSSAGEILETAVEETLIRSRVRGVYSEVNDLFAKGDNSEFAEKYREVLPTLLEMKELYTILKGRASARGAVELDTEEAVILLDENGMPCNIIPRERGDAERLIEQFMLAANEGVATFLSNLSLPCVYRVHEPPSSDKLDAFTAFASGLGLDTRPLRERKIYPSSFSKMLAQSREMGVSGVVSSVMLRAMMKAKYSHECAPHFGLAIDKYSHFTSPIRRYPDLSVHRILKEMLHGRAVGRRLSELSEFAKDSAFFSSENELRALSAEREIDDLYKTIFMSSHIGEEFEGVISSVTSFGLFVQLENTVEGLVHIDSLGSGFSFDEKNLILSRGLRAYRLGERVKVIIREADIPSRKISMLLAEE